MGIRSRLHQQSLQANVPGPMDDYWFVDRLGQQTHAGYPVSPDSAIRISAVNACVGLITDTIGGMPPILYKKQRNGFRVRAYDHPLYPILHRRPNVRQTRFRFFTHMTRNLARYGNAFAEKHAVRGLWPLHPDRVTVEELDSGRARYKVTERGQASRYVLQDDMLHWVDLGDEPGIGASRVVLAQEAIALAGAGEGYAGRFLKNDGSGRVVMSHPSKLDDKTRAEIHSNYNANLAGWQNKSKLMLAEAGVKVEMLGQLSESGFLVDPRKFQISDICRYWRVWPFMIGHEDKITWGTNIEQIKQGYIDFTARPWGINIEQELMASLLDDNEQEDYVIEFLYDSLLRGDTLQRMQAYQIGRMIGMYSPNDLLRMENRNPREDEGGDDYLDTPVGGSPNANEGQPAKRIGAPVSRPVDDEDADEDEDEEATAIPAAMLADAARRIAGGEVKQVAEREAKAADNPPRFSAWVREYFAERKTYITGLLAPYAESYGLEMWAVQEVARRCERTAIAALANGVPVGWGERRREEVAEIITETFNAPAARLKEAA